MKFIAPLEIASKIMTLIVEAEEELILVSPYVRINNWDKMKKSLSKAVDNGVKITFIARQDTNDDLKPLNALNICPILIKDLHAKVYINDKYAIVTSQNITHYSDINSIDVGYQTENEKERLELVAFVNNYITNKKGFKNIASVKTEELEVPDIESIIVRVEQLSSEAALINNKQFLQLVSRFKKKYIDTTFVSTDSYLFSGHLLPYSDVMISSRYLIKIKKSTRNCEKFIEVISRIKFDFKHTFKVELETSHKSYYYLRFAPQTLLNIDDLISDFENITDSILKDESLQKLTSLKL